ncbi:MAG: zinc-ribbon domain-containing protein [Candidatus Bathyarchaeota archaeon]|nr:zinc-ribbon domain-containing protein [Candidatus Bathyarchaeota archaeon]
MSTCPNCGREVPSGAVFCSYCGASLTAMPPPPPPPPPTFMVEVPISYQIQTATILFDEKASRLELIARIVWNFLVGLVGFVYSLAFSFIILFYSIAAGILNIINFIKILITGKRWKKAFDWQAKLIYRSATYYARLHNYWMRRAPYFGLMIDKRPSLNMEPEPLKTPGGSPA